MALMNQDLKFAAPESVLLENSNVTTTTAQDHSSSAMETTIVETDLMSEIAISLVILGCSSVRIPENAFLVDSFVMVIPIVEIVLMKPMKFARIRNETAQQKSLDVQTTNVSARLGDVTSKMIVEINPTKPPIAHLLNAQEDGPDVQAVTDASQIGHSVTDKTIAEMDLMKTLAAVLLVILSGNSNVQRLKSASLDAGCVILKTIVEIILMKPMENVEEPRDLAVKVSSDATMEGAFQQARSVMELSSAVTDLMKANAV